MKHVELRIDWTKCIKDTHEWPGKDEMYMVGKIFPADRPKSARGIDFHLGDFKKGQREEYGGTELIKKGVDRRLQEIPDACGVLPAHRARARRRERGSGISCAG
ncbi:MAG: hypothetical protein IPK72_22515 [Candidatus Eisenbacteria bacterium]|nr:hypothetical protein [Candidatus Eisenbacteria bacterium]